MCVYLLADTTERLLTRIFCGTSKHNEIFCLYKKKVDARNCYLVLICLCYAMLLYYIM